MMPAAAPGDALPGAAPFDDPATPAAAGEGRVEIDGVADGNCKGSGR